MTVQPITPVAPVAPIAAPTVPEVSPQAAAAVATQVATIATRPDVQASTTGVASQASGVLGLVGLTGSGKTRQACEAIEYCYQTYGKISLVYSSDLGGWGNKMLSLIRLGMARAWYMRNHADAFATVELATMGAFPAEILGPDTGYADPHVELILPRRVKWVPLCPNGHPIGRFVNEPEMTAALTPGRPCPTCQTVTNMLNPLRIDRVIVRPAMFDNVGLRVYDSMTQINDWGMADLQDQSAKGLLPRASKNKKEDRESGSALGSADALRSGGFSWGTSSISQYGFLQQRTYGWIANVRSIPDQVVPAVMTFGIELGKGDDESGGQPVMGPKIAGNARTSSVPGWLGNCLHLVLDPVTPPMMTADGELLMQHRIWTQTHVLATDHRHIPYLAKHRGDPGAMPAFLADGPEEAPFTTCSLKVFLQLLETQRAAMEIADRARYPEAPGLVTGAIDDTAETVIGDAPALGAVPGAMPIVAPVGGVTPVPVAVTPVVVPVAPVAAATSPAAPAAAATPPVVVAGPAGNAPVVGAAGDGVTPAPATLPLVSSVMAPSEYAAPPVVSAATTTRLQRTPRPPTV